MKRCIVGLGIALLAPTLLDASIFGRSTAKAEYEQLKSKIAAEGKKILGRIPKSVGNAKIFDTEWNDLVAAVNAYSAKYGGKVSQEYKEQVAAFQKLIDAHRAGLPDGYLSGLDLQIDILHRAIAKVGGERLTLRERRYALELYEALFWQLKNIAQASSGESYKLRPPFIDAFFGNGTFNVFATSIIKKSKDWLSLRTHFRNAVPVGNEEYEALLNYIEERLALYNKLYLAIKPADRSSEINIRAKDILRVLARDIKSTLERNADEPAFKVYGPLLVNIYSGLVAQVELGHK